MSIIHCRTDLKAPQFLYHQFHAVKCDSADIFSVLVNVLAFCSYYSL